MHFGNLNNAAINDLIASGSVSYEDTVYSTDWNETLYYDGVVFRSICSCNYIGTIAPCLNGCEPIQLVTVTWI